MLVNPSVISIICAPWESTLRDHLNTVRALANRDAGIFSARCNGRSFRRQSQSPVKNVRARPDNSLLAALPALTRRRLTADRAPVDLVVPEILSHAGERIRHVYFPIDGFISLITPAKGRGQLEIGLVGREGMLGVPLLLGVNVSPVRAMCKEGGARGGWMPQPCSRNSRPTRACAPHSTAIYMYFSRN
jgi:hypothetical protein